jgi:hypothetical protein
MGQTQINDGHQTHLFCARNIAGGPNTVTATFSGTNNHSWLAIYEYSGLSTTAPLDRTSTGCQQRVHVRDVHRQLERAHVATFKIVFYGVPKNRPERWNSCLKSFMHTRSAGRRSSFAKNADSWSPLKDANQSTSESVPSRQ